ncbi:MAG: patatin-like phospholipase family protein [Rhizobacter sp.]
MPLFKKPALGLALQGGGAHGAFTWGVLDRLLEADRFHIDAISGTSAGAMNAIALAEGWRRGGAEGARDTLKRFWTAIGTRVPFELLTSGDVTKPGFNAAARALMHWTRMLSPYQFNPLGNNPLREVLQEQIDFDALRRTSPMALFIAATHANTGRLRLFSEHELSVEAALASACLPTLHHAVMIDGEPYWDGGYSANPALFPLARMGVSELLVVTLLPLQHQRMPKSADEIQARALEFAFNATFLREARTLAEACAEARRSAWPFIGALERRLRRLHLHLIDAHEELGELAGETRLIAHLPFLENLRDLGRARAERWLLSHADDVGHRSSIDLAALYAPV